MISITTARARRRAARSRFFATDLGARATQLVGNELAENLLQYFDPVERGRALAVNRRWRVVGAHLEARDEAALWTQDLADRRACFERAQRADDYFRSCLVNEVRDTESTPWRVNPLVDSLIRRYACGIPSGRVEDGVGFDGTSSAASFVNFFLFLRTKNVVGNVLIIAPDTEMPKWMTALQKLPVEMPVTRCFKSDLTQMLSDDRWLHLGDGDIHVHLCAAWEAAKYWRVMNETLAARVWKFFILDESPGPWRQIIRQDCKFGFRDVRCENRFLLYRPRHRLTFDDAIFHFSWIKQVSERCTQLLACEDKFTLEVVRRFFSSYLDVSIMSAAPGYRIGRAHEHLLTSEETDDEEEVELATHA